MQIIKNYLYNATYQIFILLVPLITTPYLARILGPTGVGINAYTNSIIQYFILFGSIGVNLYGNRQIAFVRDDKAKLTSTFYEIFLMRLMTITIAYLIFFVFLVIIGKYQIFYLAQSVSIIAAAFDISWFFMGIEKFSVTVIRNFIVKIVTLICIFLFVRTSTDLATYILILSLSLLIGNMTLFPNLKKRIGKIQLKDLHIWKHLKPSTALFIPQIATQIYLVVNKTMLGSLTSVEAAGYFDQSDKIIKMVLAIVTATGTVMLPHVANAFMRGKIEKTKKYLYTSFRFVSIISIPLMFGIMAVSSKFVPLFFTKQFMAVIPLMSVEAIAILLIAWSNALGTQYLIPTNQTRSYTKSVILGAVVNIVVNVPLILSLGALGATVSTVLSEMIVTGYQMYSVRKQVNFRMLFKSVHKFLIAGISMFLVVKIVDLNTRTSWTTLLIEVILGMLVYTISLLLMHVSFKTEIKNL
ncbi:oligosaccharide flippase family protein [Pediococcus parvulus]|uniref:oligosaccharide flippase family protein n=1 Tax=Pediococcus parvulus TaxID=54062 RepID=UPI0021A509C3|nr:polysaccharide biosynthesis C-terminal domain-containing protein [Pediococcus parvulus]MCT3034567.1 flippase [Pediococcus parvulus]